MSGSAPSANPPPGDCRSLVMTVLMTPDMANFSGNVHGGAILRILDQVAYSCASSYAKSYVVTLSVDRVLLVPALVPQKPLEIQRFNSARLRRKAQRRQFDSAHGCDQTGERQK
jgi:Thioesterase superfamily